MGKFVPRSISFIIPGKLGIGVQVAAVETADGNLDFAVDVAGSPKHANDLRGLFFNLVDETDLAGLKILGGDGLITGTQVKNNGVIDLGGGNNLNGAASPFDIGIAFGTPGKGKDVINGPVHFTLDAASPLTLDDISHVLFGARLTSVGDKLVFKAPAAPDAIDDPVSASTTIHEDTKIIIPVLANDTDADGDALKVTALSLGPDSHGTAEISADGKSIIYTPANDYAGANTDSDSIDARLQYAISDGHGGQDSATVDIHVIPVADAPKVTIECLAPLADDPVNLIRLKVTATQTDADGSEFIDRISFSPVPDGVKLTTDGVLTTAGQPGVATEMVTLELTPGQDINFNFTATAYSQEKGQGVPDEASGSGFIAVGLDFNQNHTTEYFKTAGQSIWSTGSTFAVDKNFFFGDTGSFDIPSLVDGHVKAGFTANLHLNSGDITATLPVDLEFDTTYNTTSDSLLIETSDKLGAGATFSTHGPQGSFALGFLIDWAIDAGILGDWGGSETLPAIPNFPDPFDSSTSTFTESGFWGSLAVNWPQLAAANQTQSTDGVSGEKLSNDFFSLTADLDGLAFSLLFPSGPLHDLLGAIGPDYQAEDPNSTFQIVDLDITAKARLLEKFVLKLLDVDGSLKFEDGTTQSFKLGDDIVIRNAKSHDVDGNGLTFTVDLTPHATLDNDITAKLELSGLLKIFDPGGGIGGAAIKAAAGLLDIDLPIQIPLFSTPLGDVSVVDSTPFELVGFSKEDFTFGVVV